MQYAIDFLEWTEGRGVDIDEYQRTSWARLLANEVHVPYGHGVEKISYVRSGNRIVTMIATEDGMTFYDAVVTRIGHCGSL
jgi:L-2-hydroxyglutarate oxidase LhgO